MKYVASLGQKAVAFTDHEALGGVNKHLIACEELKEKGQIPQDFKVIIGNEIYLVDEDEMNQQMANKERVPFYHFILLAKDDIGYRQLKELSTRAWMRMFVWRRIERKPTFYTDIEEIVGSNPGHLIATSSCLGGYVAKHILSEEYDKVNDFISWCQDVFGKENFYLEMQPHLRKYDENGEEIITEQEIVNTWIRDRGIQSTIATDAHYLKKDQRMIHNAFLTSDNDEDRANARERADFYETTYHMGSQEIHEHLDFYLGEDFVNECIMNTWKIKESIGEYNIHRKQAPMEIPLPNQEDWYYTDEVFDFLEQNEEHFPNVMKMLDSENLYDGYLVSLCMKGATDEFLVSREEWFEVWKRVDAEFEEILGISKAGGYNMSAYFITMNKFIDIIWNEANAILGVSRGSAAGFMINYLLDVVQINPLKQPVEMPLWRFIERNKVELPDVDIDIPSHKRDAVFTKARDYMHSIGGELVRVGTYKTETSKSAIQTACRGLGVSQDERLYLSSLIPVDRGTVRTIYECYYGNKEKGFEPVAEFVRQVNKYPNLIEVALSVEGLISSRGSHAAGVIPHRDILDCCALMKAPNGEITTQFDLGDCEMCGGLKYDYLNTESESLIQHTMELLVEHGHIEWEGNLRDTYRASIHPNNLDYDNPKYYEALNEGKLLNAFQFDTPVSQKVLHKIEPKSLLELANTNSLMRLMSDGEQPSDRYVRLRENPEQWEQEMIDYGLTKEEREILHNHLDKDCGTLSSQEGLMLLTQDPNVANFDVPKSNVARKAIAKKKANVLEKAKKLFYECGEQVGARKIFLDYIWNIQFSMQFGYAFSILHTIGYSTILVQELELITSYPSIYWNTSVLLTESGTIEQDTNNEDEDGREGSTNYGAMGGAIATLQKQGVDIALPDINKALTGFIPDEQTNSIIFGLKGISSINNKTADIIINNRPYVSMKDFHDRLHLVKQEVVNSEGKVQRKALISKEQMINLIKAGAFDMIEPDKSRVEVLEEYLHMEYPDKKAITTSNLDQLINRGLIPSEYDEELMYYDFREYLRQGVRVEDGALYFQQDSNYKVTKSKKWYLLDGVDEADTQEVVDAFFNMFPELQQGKHWEYVEDDGQYYSNAIWVESGSGSKDSFEGVYKRKIARLMDFMRSDELLQAYNESLFRDVKKAHMEGTVASWEFDSLAMYHSDHELSHINKEIYGVSDFFLLGENPTIEGVWDRVDSETGEVRKIPKFKLHRLCGVVLDKVKNWDSIRLLTENGVVLVKFGKGVFSHYDRGISVKDEETGKNVTVEGSWFKKGTLLFVHGYRDGDIFRVKHYKNSLYSHSAYKITNVYEDGIVAYVEERQLF